MSASLSAEEIVRYDLGDDAILTVCDACMRAGCWATAWYCEDYETAGTTEITVARARELALESPQAWIALRREEGIR